MAEFCEWFLRQSVNNAREKGTHLILCGNSGTGKTASMRRVAEQCAAWGVEASLSAGWRGVFPFTLWIEWPAVVESSKPEKFEDALYDLKTAQIVFIDDVGSESDKFKSGEAASRLRRVLQA